MSEILFLKGIISFTASFMGKKASNMLEKNRYKEIDEKFTKIVRTVSNDIQKIQPDILGGSIDQIFTDESILTELISILYKKNSVDIEKIYSKLDKDTLPKNFIEEFVIQLKKALLEDRLFNDLLSEKDTFNSIESIEELLREKFTDNFRYDEFLDSYKETAINNISQVNYFGLSLSPEVKKSRKLLTDIYVIPNFKTVSLEKNQDEIIDSTISDFDVFEKEISKLDFDSLIDGIYHKNFHTVILGKPGAGKSILIKYLMHQLLTNNINHPLSEYMPIRIELRKYLQYKKYKKLNIKNYVHDLLISEYGLTNISFENVSDILSNEKILILFDGLDEIFHVNDKLEVENDIENFLTLHKKAKGIVTSRNNGYEEAKLNEKIFIEVEIMDFDDEKIKEYLEKWYGKDEKDAELIEEEANSFMALKKELDPVLISNPLSLSLIVILYRNMGKLPNSKLEIYRGCTKTLVEEWDDFKELNIELKVKSKKTRIFTNLAFWQYTKLSENQENNAPLTYRNVLHEVERIISNLSDSMDDELEIEKIAKEFLEYAEKRSIYFDNNFTHKTFHEYFTALWIYQNFDAKGKFQERNNIISKYIDNSYWHIVLDLLLSMIDERQGDDDVINELITVQIKNTENITAHFFLLYALKNINNVGIAVVKRLMKQSIRLSIKSFNIDKKMVAFRSSTNSNRIFYEIDRIKNDGKYEELLKEVLKEIEEELINDNENFLKYIIFINELYRIDVNKEPYSKVIKNYETISPYIYQVVNEGEEDYFNKMINFIDIYGNDPLFDIYSLWYRNKMITLGYGYNYLLQENKNKDIFVIKENLEALKSKGLDLNKLKRIVTSDIGFNFDDLLVNAITEIVDADKIKKMPRKMKKELKKKKTEVEYKKLIKN